jgi:hypothetical protein
MKKILTYHHALRRQRVEITSIAQWWKYIRKDREIPPELISLCPVPVVSAM